MEHLLGGHRLDAGEKRPLYVQLGQYLRRRIRDGTLRPGTRLPTEKEMQRLFRVSRMTVRQALEVLVYEGLIRRRRGQGTEVLAPPPEVVLDRRRDLEQALRARGRPVYRHAAGRERRPAPADVACFLQVAPERLVLWQLSLLFVDGERVACCEQYQRGEPAEGDDRGPTPAPPLAGQQSVELVAAVHPVTDHLKVPLGTPLLRHVLGLYRDGLPWERQVHHYRSDRYRYRFRL